MTQKKEYRNAILIIFCVIFLAVVLVAVCVGMRLAPAVNHALRISELLQPMLNSKNQAMHLSVSAQLGSKALAVESDVYLVAEDGLSYLAVERNGACVYIADNLMFLENGKAFKLGDKLQADTSSVQELLPHIGLLYKALTITAEETETEAAYTITVTDTQIDALLAAASLGEDFPVEAIEKLNVRLAERDGKLASIVCSGTGIVDGTAVTLDVTLSGFRILALGDYPIPEAVRQSVATADPDTLFSLSEDLYRLVLALAPFADMESIDGTLTLAVNCGMLQVDTEMALSDLKTTSDRQLDPEKLRALPQMLGWLCMAGDISCTQNSTAYVYILELDQQAMQELSQMILPELQQYGSNLSAGSVTVTIEDDAIASMGVSIEGNINALFIQIPVEVEAAFTFAQT
jgi:hypothetical protein